MFFTYATAPEPPAESRVTACIARNRAYFDLLSEVKAKNESALGLAQGVPRCKFKPLDPAQQKRLQELSDRLRFRSPDPEPRSAEKRRRVLNASAAVWVPSVV
jgi:hypothetical protein